MTTVPSPPGGGVHLDDVHLSGDTPQGPTVVPGLSLVADSRGFTVVGPQPGVERTLTWPQIDQCTFRDPAVLPDGRPATVLEVTVDGRSLRFLLAVERISPVQATAIEAQLNTLLAVGRAPVSSGSAGPASTAPVPPTIPSSGPPPAPAGAPLPPPVRPLGNQQGGRLPPAPFSLPPGVTVRGQGPDTGALEGFGAGQGTRAPVSPPSPYTGYEGSVPGWSPTHRPTSSLSPPTFAVGSGRLRRRRLLSIVLLVVLLAVLIGIIVYELTKPTSTSGPPPSGDGALARVPARTVVLPFGGGARGQLAWSSSAHTLVLR